MLFSVEIAVMELDIEYLYNIPYIYLQKGCYRMLKCGIECKWHIAEYCSRSYPKLKPNPFLHFCDNSTGSQALAQQQEADAGPVLS